VSYEDALLELASRHPELLVLTAENRAAIRNVPRQLGDRFIDFGICEQAMVGAAAGLALRRRIPVVHGLAAFLTMRAFEFIRTDIGLPNLPVILVGGIPGFLSEANGPTHQALEDVALMRGIPNMHVFCPADEAELSEGLARIVERRVPCYIRFNPAPAVVELHAPLEIGRAEVLAEGVDVTILSYGLLVREGLEAMRILARQGISVRLVNMRMLKPLDEQVVRESAARTPLIVTLEDHFLAGGLHAAVASVLVQAGYPCRVLPLAMGERWFRPGRLPDVLRHEGFTGDQVAQRIRKEVEAHAAGFRS
jgi:transketolase